MTIEEFYDVIVASAGASDATWIGEDRYDRTFDELGYDSLALIEAVARIEEKYGVSIPEEQVAEQKTPRSMLSLVNTAILAG